MPELWLVVAVAAVVVSAAVVQFGLGLGFGMLAAPLLALLDPELVPAPVLTLGLLTSGWGALRERQGIVWREVGLAVVGRASGMGLALLALALVPGQEGFSLLFGSLVALAVALSVAGPRLPFTPGWLAAMGGVSGLMGTITSIGAPPLALLYQDKPGREARPTLAAFFALGCGISLVGLLVAGHAGLRDLALAAAMAPGIGVGYVISARLAQRFDRRYRGLLLGVSGVAGVLLILRGLW